jgi:hypothetical protein
MRGPDRIERLLLIGDPHADPAYPNDRFDWLGAHIAARKPDVVLCIGDAASMQSLSDHDQRTAIFEGRRYEKDCEAMRDALQRIHAPVTHAPLWVLVGGNHEAFIDRYANRFPELIGTIGARDLGFHDHGWEVAPFLTKYRMGGFTFSHFFANRRGKPIGGDGATGNVSEALVRTQHTSCVAGHTHIKSYTRHWCGEGRPIHALNLGCFAAFEHDEGWSRGTQDQWWRGVVELEGVSGGDFEAMTWTSMVRLRERYARTSNQIASSCAAPAADVSDLSYDDVPATAISRPADDAPNTVWARYLGYSEKWVRTQRERGIPPELWTRRTA